MRGNIFSDTGQVILACSVLPQAALLSRPIKRNALAPQSYLYPSATDPELSEVAL